MTELLDTTVGWQGAMHAYLRFTPVIDWTHPMISATAQELAWRQRNPEIIAARCCAFIRKNIRHSSEHQLSPTLYRASDVLEQRHGVCHARVILLVALLRANGIPAGFSSPRVAAAEITTGFCRHSLTAIHLPSHGWIRINRQQSAAHPPPDQLPAFVPWSADSMTLHPDPHPDVLHAFSRNTCWDALMQQLPDRATPSDANLP